MDHAMKDRREDGRFAPPVRADVRATLRPGCSIDLVNVSARGALVQAPKPLRPGGRVHLQVLAASRRYAISAFVLRCLVSAIDPQHGVIYRGALRFDHAVEWGWAAPTRRVQAMPEHAGPTGTNDGQRLPGWVSEGRVAGRDC